jgi:phosphoribosylformylglycinamidine synthase
MDTVRERAAEGAPVLGICNGAQVLVEAGLVPGGEGGHLGAALAPNLMPDRSGYLARWVWCEVQGGPSLFTQAYAAGEILPWPIAHAEGRFATGTAEEWARLEASRQVAVRYRPSPGAVEREGPPRSERSLTWNPNGSLGAAAAVGNALGNVLALMPHPERAQDLLQVPLDLPGPWGERRRRLRRGGASPWGGGPGAGVFLSLAAALGVREAVVAAAGLRGGER